VSKRIRSYTVIAFSLILISAAVPARAQVSFSNPTNYAVGTSPAAVGSSDHNGDGKLDLAVANRTSYC
jgi:hypothetical protein